MIEIVCVLIVAVLVAVWIRSRIEADHAGSYANSCINNLRQIDAAKQQWALEHGAGTNAVPSWNDLAPYIGRLGSTNDIYCPRHGTYTIGRVADVPRCSVPHHSLIPAEQ